MGADSLGGLQTNHEGNLFIRNHSVEFTLLFGVGSGCGDGSLASGDWDSGREPESGASLQSLIRYRGDDGVGCFG